MHFVVRLCTPETAHQRRGRDKAGHIGGDGGGDRPAAAPDTARAKIDRQHIECRLGRAEHDGGGCPDVLGYAGDNLFGFCPAKTFYAVQNMIAAAFGTS